jgi:aminodeoxyfutalosine deaminase
MLLRARLLLPVSAPAIHDGAVRIADRRIVAVGRWRDLASGGRGRAVDLGDVVLLPGLVNAHCHLDYTGMAGQLPPPKIFIDWLKAIMEIKEGWSLSDYKQSWLSGARMLLRTGTTTVADIEAVPELLPEVWQKTPLRVYSFLELIGITSRRPPRQVLQAALDKIQSLRNASRPLGLSPHAPYSTVPELLRLSAQTASRRHWRLTTHLAESALEVEMFGRRGGAMFHWLERSGRDMSDCGLGSPIQHAARCGLLKDNCLAVHANCLGRKDGALLAAGRVHVVHCPRSYFYFAHGGFSLRRLCKAGVNVCLGTDSLASVYKKRGQVVGLDMFEEMRALAQREPWLSPKRLLQMATLNGARALGMAGQVGELAPRAYADIIALPLTTEKRDAYETVLRHTGHVAASMISGQWALGPGGVEA